MIKKIKIFIQKNYSFFCKNAVSARATIWSTDPLWFQKRLNSGQYFCASPRRSLRVPSSQQWAAGGRRVTGHFRVSTSCLTDEQPLGVRPPLHNSLSTSTSSSHIYSFPYYCWILWAPRPWLWMGRNPHDSARALFWLLAGSYLSYPRCLGRWWWGAH